MEIPHDILDHCLFGLEREALRINQNGKISRLSHPKQLGSPLTHPFITTDYAESQIEWNTSPCTSSRSALKFLENLMAYTTQESKSSLFWPYSLPPQLSKEIAIANYGNSSEGKKKEIYRKGLKHRYGQNLQMISGTHFNFSFSQPLLQSLYFSYKKRHNFREFCDALYLKMIRNTLREGWLITYLFGMSPAIDATYMPTVPRGMKKLLKHTLYGEYATSIRMSSLGYYSRIQNQLSISFNDLKTYIRDMKYALATPKKAYQNIPVQLNDSILQIPSEHYGRIRPKTTLERDRPPLDTLEDRGIEYLELRSLDINPYTPSGIDQESLLFLSLFLIYCAQKNSPPLNKESERNLVYNQNQVALRGRQPGLRLMEGKQKRTLKAWGTAILMEMKKLGKQLDFPGMQMIEDQFKKLRDPKNSPSARIIYDLIENQLELRAFGLFLAKTYRTTFSHQPLPKKITQQLSKATKESMQAKQALETKSRVLLEGYEHLEISTQVLIREALKRNVQVEVLDAKDNIIRLKKGLIAEYVKQATKTSKDSYITQQLLENKQMTKDLLREKGFTVPDGRCYSSRARAHSDYCHFAKKRVVIKGKSTNSGEGISFVAPHDKESYISAVDATFGLCSSVIVEQFFPWKEYRILVIGEKTVGVLCREGAHVIGDGAYTIKELVDMKNHDPTYYRHPGTEIRLGQEEKRQLARYSLTPSSLPKKGRKIILRQNSNLSTGGDAKDVTDTIHPGYKQIAEEATRAFGVQVCGVDMLIQSAKQKPSRKNQVIIELNHNPILFAHAFPYKGHQRDIAGPLLDLLNL